MSENIIEINPDNINDYYRKINDAIDEYFEKHNIRPSSLKRFLKPESSGLKLFIEKNKLTNVKNIEKVILDVVDDRVSMVDDGVLTFENFKLHENHIHPEQESFISRNLSLNEDPITYKKILADYFRTSLGHIDDLNEDSQEHYNNEFHVNGTDVFILSEKDIISLEESVVEHALDQVKALTFDDVAMDFKLPEIEIADLIDDNKFEKELYNKLSTDDIVDIINEELVAEDYDKVKVFKEFYIWER